MRYKYTREKYAAPINRLLNLDTDSLRKRRLFSTFFVSAGLLLFGSPFLVNLTELSPIDIKDILCLSKFMAGFPAYDNRAFDG